MSECKQASVRYGAIRITVDADIAVNHLRKAVPAFTEKLAKVDLRKMQELGVNLDAALSALPFPEVTLDDALALQEKQWKRDHEKHFPLHQQ